MSECRLSPMSPMKNVIAKIRVYNLFSWKDPRHNDLQNLVTSYILARHYLLGRSHFSINAITELDPDEIRLAKLFIDHFDDIWYRGREDK